MFFIVNDVRQCHVWVWCCECRVGLLRENSRRSWRRRHHSLNAVTYEDRCIWHDAFKLLLAVTENDCGVKCKMIVAWGCIVCNMFVYVHLLCFCMILTWCHVMAWVIIFSLILQLFLLTLWWWPTNMHFLWSSTYSKAYFTGMYEFAQYMWKNIALSPLFRSFFQTIDNWIIIDIIKKPFLSRTVMFVI